MIPIFSHIGEKLSRKILAALSLSVAAVMSLVILVTITQETKEMLKEVDTGSDELTTAIYAGIKYPMSVGNNEAVQRQMMDIRERMKNIEVFICDTERRIVFCSDPDRLRKDITESLGNSEVLSALDHLLKTGEQPDSIFEEQAGGSRYLVHIHAIQNQPECYRCHGSAKHIIGAAVLRKNVDRKYAAIAGLRDDTIIISVLGIIVFISLAHALMKRTIILPIQRLARDIKALPDRISSGEPLATDDTDRADEIGVLQKTFNHMATELVSKTHAIEESRRDIERANKELEAFAYSVSHDLRAPLRNIDGFSKILLDEHGASLDDQAKHYLNRVRNGTTRMSELIDDMLTFSRIGRAELRMRRVQASQIISGVLENYADAVRDKNVTVTVEDLPAVYGDPVLLQSLFANLISNAIKFAGAGGRPEIGIGYDRRIGAFFVRDNGIGFDMQYHDKIFQVFQRLHLPEEYEGTGIGLAIVKRIAERHGGTIWAESTPGSGATFFVRLPASQEE